MPPILNAQSVTKQFGAKPLFLNVSLTVEDGDRIGLIGPNGAGKSTLLALLAGQVEPDSGELAVRKRARAAYVPQDSRFAPGLTIRQVLENALAAAQVNEAEREGRLRELTGRAGFADLNAEAASLSGGWRKRLAITEAMVIEPEVMLLDEPTNHLDLAGIEWLEELLRASPFASVTVSHDRYFLESTSSQIVELNRVFADGLFRVKGTFSRFLEEKQAYLESQSKQQESLRNQVKTEIEWLRRGPKARTTKSKARIDSANEMIGQLKAMDSRTTVNSAGIDFEASQRKTKRLVEFTDVACDVPAVGPGFIPDITPTALKGHDFSRAENNQGDTRALAPEGSSPTNSTEAPAVRRANQTMHVRQCAYCGRPHNCGCCSRIFDVEVQHCQPPGGYGWYIFTTIPRNEPSFPNAALASARSCDGIATTTRGSLALIVRNRGAAMVGVEMHPAKYSEKTSTARANIWPGFATSVVKSEGT